MKKTTIHPLRLVILSALAFAGCEVPEEQKLADCATNSLSFAMTVQNSAPYEFVLGVPQSQIKQLSFSGQIVLQQGTDVVARIPISSHDTTPCNWLHSTPDLSGYILTFSRTNHGERLSDLLVQKQSYKVHVDFTDPPPAGSSLWLASMKR
jgi:hypothetical protein